MVFSHVVYGTNTRPANGRLGYWRFEGSASWDDSDPYAQVLPGSNVLVVVYVSPD